MAIRFVTKIMKQDHDRQTSTDGRTDRETQTRSEIDRGRERQRLSDRQACNFVSMRYWFTFPGHCNI